MKLNTGEKIKFSKLDEYGKETITKDIYEVKSQNRSNVIVINKRTNKEEKWHITRIIELVDRNIKIEKKEKKKGEVFDFLSVDGEIWLKECKFDHKKVKCESICILNKDVCITFNLYNNRLGKKNKKNTYPLKDREKKIKQLLKKGYVRR